MKVLAGYMRIYMYIHMPLHLCITSMMMYANGYTTSPLLDGVGICMAYYLMQYTWASGCIHMLPLLDSVCMVLTTACSGMDTCTASDGTRGVCIYCMYCMHRDVCIYMCWWCMHSQHVLHAEIYHGYVLMDIPAHGVVICMAYSWYRYHDSYC